MGGDADSVRSLFRAELGETSPISNILHSTTLIPFPDQLGKLPLHH